MGIYMSYDGYCALLDQSSSVATDKASAAAAAPSTKPGISCYEIVLAEPVKNFAYNAVSFPSAAVRSLITHTASIPRISGSLPRM